MLKEIFLLLSVWAIFLVAFIVLLRSSVQGTPIPLESIAANPFEKRLYQRRHLPLAVNYAVLEKPEYQGATLSRDIGKGGVCIPLPVLLKQGSKLRLSIQLPKLRRPLSIWGEVVWQAPHPSNRFETGIRFIQLTSS